MKGLTVLKIGGSVITFKDRPFSENEKALKRISLEISRAFRKKAMKLAVVHGAGSFGHYMVKESGIHRGIKNRKQLIAFADTQRWQNYWNVQVTERLQEAGIPAIPCQASSSAVMENGSLMSMDVSAVKGFLKLGMVPVLFGVPAYDVKKGCSILSGDEIVSWLGKELSPERVIHGIDVDGVFTKDPKRNKNAKLIKSIGRKSWKGIKKGVRGSDSVDVTGGMLKKVSEVMKAGIKTFFVNACVPGNLEKALSGKRVKGTLIDP